MSESIIYRYTATSTGGSDYNVNHGSQDTGAAVISELSPGDQFVFDGKVYSFDGGADLGSGGPEVGFFATNKAGKEFFFSTTALSQNQSLVLNTSQTYTICFMAGTRIATLDGSVPVETLAIGDLVRTADGNVAPVRWLGRQTISTTFANPNRVLPIRIKAGALEQNLPERDLLVSPCHAILLDGVLVQAGALINGTTIVRETDVPSTFPYYHVELENHALILAEGVEAETFIDNVDRLAFDNWDEHERLYPESRSIPEMSYPRAASARQVPSALKRKLTARAELVTSTARNAA